MSSQTTIRDRIIAALRHAGPVSVSWFIEKMGSPSTEDEQAIWHVVGDMEKNGEVNWDGQDMYLTRKAGV